MTNKLTLLLRISVTLFVWILGGYILNKYEYFIAFGDIDNILGMIPVALILVCMIGVTVIIWMKHRKQNILFSALIVLLVISSVALFPTAMKSDWWINLTTSDDVESIPDFTLYAPFSDDSKLAKLNEPSELNFTNDFPVLDGATALYPVYAAFAEAVYDESTFSNDSVLCTNTSNAYKGIITGEKDIVFVASASEQQMAAAREVGVDLHFTPIGREAFVFLVGKENPVENVTYQQLRNIYSGKTSYWNTLGWREGGKIIAFQRPEGSGSQTGIQRMVMTGLPIQSPQPLPNDSLIGTNSLMKQVSAEWHGVQPAIGYSYRYYATTMYANPDSKLLKVNGIEPSIDNIRDGSYPFVGDFYAVTNGEPKGNTKRLIDWILSPQGQEIIEKTGYTPLLNN